MPTSLFHEFSKQRRKMILLYKTIGLTINLMSYISPKISGRLAWSIFSTPLKGRIREADFDFLDTAFKEELNQGDLPVMTYRWLGKNKTILLAHGWESNSARWKLLINRLKKYDYNIIAVDAPAHGRSGSKQFNAILYSEFINVAAKKFNPDVIVGHSVGGMAAIFYLHKYKNLDLEKLVLLGAPSNYTGVFKRYVKMMGYNDIVYKQIGKIVLKKYGHLLDYFSAAEFTKSINTTGLIIHDQNDEVIPFNDAKHFQQYYKNAQLIPTKGLDHSLNNEKVFEHINDFIAVES